MFESFSHFLEHKNKKYEFSSVLYLLPDKLAKQVYNWSFSCVDDKSLYTVPGEEGYGREDESHCTVMYGIHEKTPKEIRRLLKKVEPFDIKLGKINAFTNPEKFDVLKIEVLGTGLHKLHDLIKNNVEVTESYPEYKPHVTIAYLKKGHADKYVGSDKFKDVKISVNELVFSSSAGLKTAISLHKP